MQTRSSTQRQARLGNGFGDVSPSSQPGIPSSISTDQLMIESTPMRPSLSTSLSDFALPSSSSSSPSSSMSTWSNSALSQSKDDTAPLMKRLRRPTLLNWLQDARNPQSPLASSFTPVSPEKRKGKEKEQAGETQDDSVVLPVEDTVSGDGQVVESLGFRDRGPDRMFTDNSSPSSESETRTPPIPGILSNPQIDELSDRPKSSPMDISRSASPSAAAVLKPPADIHDGPGPSRIISRRMSCPPRPPRLQSLRSESRPEEFEVKSEANFQRLLASFSGLPPGLGSNRASRMAANRGRYPEEVGEDEEYQREDTPSDDGNAEADTSNCFNFKQAGSEPINIAKPSTPGPSMGGTPEDLGLIGNISESPGNALMDIDAPFNGSPSLGIGIPPSQWRQTPPPVSSTAVRTSKRKYDDRFEPYAPAAKRRAVSPSISQLRDAHNLVSPIIIPRSPVLRPRGSFSQSQSNSATSSPTVSQGSMSIFGGQSAVMLSSQNGSTNGTFVPGHHRSGSASSAVSSPTVRASMILASPILRPVPRLAVGAKRGIGDIDGERIVDGAGEGVGSLSLGQ